MSIEIDNIIPYLLIYMVYNYIWGDVTMYDEVFSNRLSSLRLKKGVSARDMSLSLGQSESYINKIENKKSLPSMSGFFYICEYLGVAPNEFFDYRIDNPTRLNEIIEELKKLDDNSLSTILELAKGLNKTK